MFLRQIYIATLFCVASMTAIAGEARWQDPESKTQFLYLPGAVDYFEANRRCGARGWDIFNYEYLKPEEQERFLASPLMDNLAWQRKFVGEPSEHAEHSVWMSSETTAVTWNTGNGGTSTLAMKRFRNEKEVRFRIQGDGKDSKRHHTLCMYQSDTWEGCAHEVRCTYEQKDGSTHTMRYAIYEYGPHRSVAMARLRERLKNFPVGTGAKCELAPRDAHCIAYR